MVNIDETWLPSCDYRTHKWRVRGTRNSLPIQTITPRTNVIAAVDTDGSIFISLAQSNTDTAMVMLFLSRLTNAYSRQESNWRERTVFVLDGASYHRSEEARRCYAAMGLKVVITAPYSYDASPCELLFASIKRGNMNPRHIKTGKR